MNNKGTLHCSIEVTKIKDTNSHICRVAKIGDNEKSDIESTFIISSNTPTYQ